MRREIKEMDPVIDLEDVSTFYEGEKDSTLKGLCLMVFEGEFVCVMGPNGCGKTTLLETINGILPCRGRARVLDREVCQRGPEVRSRVGYMLQAKTFPEATPYLVKDVIVMGRFGRIGLLRRPGKEDWAKARQAAEYMDVYHLWKRPVGKLSGGQTQRVMLARAMAKDPRILLLDEPYASLDYRAVEDVSAKISALHRGRGLTTLMVVHDLHHVPSACTRIVLMKAGTVVADMPPAEMLASLEFKKAFSDNGSGAGP